MAGTLAWLIERYRDAGAWQSLSLATRRQRENIFKQVIEIAGRPPLAFITQNSIITGRDRRAKTAPFQARHFLDTMRGLFRWAYDAQMVKADPTAGVKSPPRSRKSGYRPWTEDDVAAYEARWPIGTRQRVWLDVLLYTGLRRGDAVRLGRQHVRDGIATIKTEKTDTEVTLPILPVLANTLAAGPCGDLIHRRLARSADGEEVLQQRLQGRVPRRRRVRFRAWRAQDRGDARRQCWRDGATARSDLRLGGWRDGVALYACG